VRYIRNNFLDGYRQVRSQNALASRRAAQLRRSLQRAKCLRSASGPGATGRAGPAAGQLPGAPGGQLAVRRQGEPQHQHSHPLGTFRTLCQGGSVERPTNPPRNDASAGRSRQIPLVLGISLLMLIASLLLPPGRSTAPRRRIRDVPRSLTRTRWRALLVLSPADSELGAADRVHSVLGGRARVVGALHVPPRHRLCEPATAVQPRQRAQPPGHCKLLASPSHRFAHGTRCVCVCSRVEVVKIHRLLLYDSLRRRGGVAAQGHQLYRRVGRGRQAALAARA